MAPGAIPALRHAHSKQDEFTYILQGCPKLYTDAGPTPLLPVMCTGFKAGILDRPPPETMAEMHHPNYVVCSDLWRSVESAHAVGLANMHVTDSLFRESVLPHFGGGPVTLPIAVWVTFCRLLWLAGFSQNGKAYAAANCRARQAATRLAGLAEAHGNVLLNCHGLMNYLIAQQLRANGWPGLAKSGKRFWKCGVNDCGAVNCGLRENVKL